MAPHVGGKWTMELISARDGFLFLIVHSTYITRIRSCNGHWQTDTTQMISSESFYAIPWTLRLLDRFEPRLEEHQIPAALERCFFTALLSFPSHGVRSGSVKPNRWPCLLENEGLFLHCKFQAFAVLLVDMTSTSGRIPAGLLGRNTLVERVWVVQIPWVSLWWWGVRSPAYCSLFHG